MEKVKKDYPRLPICLLMDGLFAKVPIKKKVKEYNWQFIIVWKEKTLYKLQDIISELRKRNLITKKQKEIIHNMRSKTILNYECESNGIDNKGVKIYYISLDKQDINIEQPQNTKKVYFMFMSSIQPDKDNIQQLIQAGRMRWNEIFGDQILTAAMVDRLTHKAILINMNGQSFRVKESQNLLS